MKRVWVVIVLMGNLWATASAIPTFQVYIDNASAGSVGSDEDTWYSSSVPFDLKIVGAFKSDTISLTRMHLVVSVPQGQTGTISITDGDVSLSSSSSSLDILTDIGGNEGYALKSEFLPPDLLNGNSGGNNHYPFQDDVSDFVVFSLLDFTKATQGLHDYNADDGSITLAANAWGEERTLAISSTGFSWLHFDVFGMETEPQGQKIVTNWDINPGSHDSTSQPHVPAPGAIVLASIGTVLVGWLRIRRRI